jgi:hypothetical protein
MFAAACLALVALGLSLCRLAARTDTANAEAVNDWLGTFEVYEIARAPLRDSEKLERTSASRGL